MSFFVSVFGGRFTHRGLKIKNVPVGGGGLFFSAWARFGGHSVIKGGTVVFFPPIKKPTKKIETVFRNLIIYEHLQLKDRYFFDAIVSGGL